MWPSKAACVGSNPGSIGLESVSHLEQENERTHLARVRAVQIMHLKN